MVAVNEAQGMMAFWTDIDDDYVMRCQMWHNCEHMVERTGIPGFLVGRRYRGMGDAPMFYITYEAVDSEVFRNDAYVHRMNNPTPWTKEALTHFNNNVRNIYVLRSTHGRQAPQEAPYALLWRFNLAPETQAEMVAWLSQKLLPTLQDIPGVFRVRLFEVEQEISNIKTAERDIDGRGPGEQKYLVYFEMSLPDIHKGDAWRAVLQSDPHASNLAKMQTLYEEVSWLEFVMYSPDVS
jgi:hypothetical protein